MKQQQRSRENGNGRLSRWLTLPSKAYHRSSGAILFWTFCIPVIVILGACVKGTIRRSLLIGLPCLAVFVSCSVVAILLGLRFFKGSGEEPYIGGFLGLCFLFAIGLIWSCTR